MLIDGLTPEEYAHYVLKRREQDKLALADAERRQARVLAVKKDGDYLTGEFLNNAGERIVAYYELRGYAQAPSKLLRHWHERQRRAKGPMTTIGSREVLARIHNDKS